MLAIFFAAVPTGAAFGYILGGLINVHWGWRSAFYIVSGPGLFRGLLCFLRNDPRSETSQSNRQRTAFTAYLLTVVRLIKTPSFGFSVDAHPAMAFALV